jgi:uncharacterized membrane protein (UPF0127 family)
MRRLAHIACSALAAVVLVASAALAACSDDAVDLRGPWGQARFSVEIADTPQSQALGLMHRESLPRNAGMLFVYDRPQTARFWMRNTLIPLDMIFAGPDGVVRHVHHEAVPLDETIIEGGDGILMVLEINGGLARRIGIAPGTELRHPRLDGDTAAWPCD